MTKSNWYRILSSVIYLGAGIWAVNEFGWTFLILIILFIWGNNLEVKANQMEGK